MKPLLLASVVAMLWMTSCNKENLTGRDANSRSPDSMRSNNVHVEDSKDSEIVEFDGFVNISAPIAQAIADGSYQGVPINHERIEMPIFKASELEVPAQTNPIGEQAVGGNGGQAR